MPIEMLRTIWFQSTPPSREATNCNSVEALLAVVSIHAPLTGGDPGASTSRPCRMEFQSTPPSREATGQHRAAPVALPVSIHAPRTGGD